MSFLFSLQVFQLGHRQLVTYQCYVSSTMYMYMYVHVRVTIWLTGDLSYLTCAYLIMLNIHMYMYV